MKSIDLTNKCGSCCHFKPVDGTAMGECLLRPYDENVAHDPNHPHQMVTRSKVKCTWHNKKPITNADRIRAMRDKELASLLATKFADLQVEANGLQMTETQLRALQHTWFRAWMQWLEQPVKEVSEC